MQFITKPLLFQTKNSWYCYDDSTRNVFPVEEHEKDFLNKIKPYEIISKADLINSNLNDLYQKIKRLSLFQSELKYPKFTKEFIEEKLLQEGVSHLCLIVTDACNFRCKYCIYSDHYQFTKSYSRKKMTFEVAKKAIDYYMDVNLQAVKYNPNISLSIGFYGGEPLLNWSLIKKVVEYIRDQYTSIFGNIFFAITTNGYLLSEEKIKYMLGNNFSISVSIDGDKETHDRNRVTINQSPTFDVVFKNMLLLEEVYENMLRENKKPVPYGILITYDNNADFEQLENFFSENPNIDNKIQRVTRVSGINTDYFNTQNDPSILQKRQQFLKNLVDKFKVQSYMNAATNFSKVILKNLILDPMMLLNYSKNELRGTCLPGLHKLAVDSDGIFHMCEKINPSYSVGNTEMGLDTNKQAEYMNNFFSLLNSKCEKCNLQNICNLCYVITESNGKGFKLDDDYCINYRKGIINSLATYYSILEENPQLFSELRE